MLSIKFLKGKKCFNLSRIVLSCLKRGNVKLLHISSTTSVQIVPHFLISVAVNFGTQTQQIYEDKPSGRRYQSSLDPISQYCITVNYLY